MPAKKKPAADVQPIELGTVTTWPLDQLAISPLNVRKTLDITDPGLDELAADIAAKGLLQGLIVHPGPAGPEDKGRLVVGGQRRYIALQRLVGSGALPKNAPVPVRDVPEDMAIEVSMAENLQRRDMNPADEAAAFAALIETGRYDAREIAKRFGFDEKHVKRRVRIAELAEPITDALRSGKITINAAEAYAMADSQDLQLKIFKANEKDSWKGHKPEQILSEIRHTGIDPTGATGKFIGGMKAYLAAGGVASIDEAFQPLLFKPDKTDERMRDGAIVTQLINQAKVDNAAKALKLACKTYPFATGFLWANPLQFDSWSQASSKPDKKTGMILVKADYSLTAEKLLARVKKAAEKHGGAVWAVVGIDGNGKLAVANKTFAVGKDAWEKSAPKKDKDDHSSHGGMSDEEREAHNRKVEINRQAERLFGRSILGETPGFGVIDTSADRDGHLRITLISMEASDFVETYRQHIWDETRIVPALLEAFVGPATAIVDERRAEKARLAAEAEEKAKAHETEREEILARLELTPLAEWPALVVVTLPDHGIDYEIRREEVDGEPLLHCYGPEGDDWESSNVLETVQLIRDAVVENDWAIEVTDVIPTEEAAAPAEAAEDAGPDPVVEAYVEEGLGETQDFAESDAELQPSS